MRDSGIPLLPAERERAERERTALLLAHHQTLVAQLEGARAKQAASAPMAIAAIELEHALWVLAAHIPWE